MGMRILALMAIILPGFFSFDMLTFYSWAFAVMYAAYMVGVIQGAVSDYQPTYRIHQASFNSGFDSSMNSFDDFIEMPNYTTDPRYAALPGNLYHDSFASVNSVHHSNTGNDLFHGSTSGRDNF